MSLTKKKAEKIIFHHMKEISQPFIKARISGMCLYASVLLKEKLDREGISMELIPGYLQTDRESGEVFRHVWLERDGNIYDVSIDILKNVSWKNSNIKFKHHKTLPSQLYRTDTIGNVLEYGIS